MANSFPRVPRTDSSRVIFDDPRPGRPGTSHPVGENVLARPPCSGTGGAAADGPPREPLALASIPHCSPRASSTISSPSAYEQRRQLTVADGLAGDVEAEAVGQQVTTVAEGDVSVEGRAVLGHPWHSATLIRSRAEQPAHPREGLVHVRGTAGAQAVGQVLQGQAPGVEQRPPGRRLTPVRPSAARAPPDRGRRRMSPKSYADRRTRRRSSRSRR